MPRKVVTFSEVNAFRDFYIILNTIKRLFIGNAKSSQIIWGKKFAGKIFIGTHCKE